MLGGGGFLAKVYFEVKLTTSSPSSDIQIVVFHPRLLPEHLSFLVMPFYFSSDQQINLVGVFLGGSRSPASTCCNVALKTLNCDFHMDKTEIVKCS